MGPAGQVLSGRAEERARLLATVRAGLDGDSRVIQVHGEAGIGKTTLVRDVCAEVAAEGVQVLWGQGLRFGTVDAMYHPLVLALEGWLRTASDSERAGLLASVPSATVVLPSLGAQLSVAPSGLMLMVDALVEHVASLRPTVLVLDDVQWADPATWDAVSYLVAGLGRQPLALVTTHRDEAVISEEFQRWLGHLRRLPRTEDLELTRLDEAETTEQVAGLMDGRLEPRLAKQVFERSRGNPYLSELLVRRLDQGSTELPDLLPDELSQALLDAWRALPGPAREVARALAVGGRPADVRTLGAVAGQLGLSVSPGVRDAVEGGVLVLDHDIVWFRHPLLVAVLMESFLPGEADAAHEAWAERLEATTSRGVDELRRLGDLARHHEAAGARAAAFANLLAAAELAEELCAPEETADLYARTLALWDSSDDPADIVAHVRLLGRAAVAAFWVGHAADAGAMMGEARDLVRDGGPMLVGYVPIQVAALTHQESFAEAVVALDTAVELTGTDPDSRAHAEALAYYADALFWDGRADEARVAADAALSAAERSGAHSAMSEALRVRSTISMPTDLVLADELAEASWRHALASGDELVMVMSAAARFLVAQASGNLRRFLDVVHEQSMWLASRGNVLEPTCELVRVYLLLGDLGSAASAVRGGLAARGSTQGEAMIRVYAGLLALRQGDDQVARQHLARAHEIMPDLEEPTSLVPMGMVADLLVGLGESQRALELIERVLPSVVMLPRFLDNLLLRGARAAADLAQQAMDRRDQDGVRRHQKALDRLVASRVELSATPAFQLSGPDDSQQTAHAALFAAELSRAGGGRHSAPWLDAASACAAAGMEWEQRVAQLHAATLLIESGAPGSEVADLLREVRAYADFQGAVPLKERAEELATSARVSLAEPASAPGDTVPAPFTGLTGREAEVLGHLVANRTYAEIAGALFISEKTVSVHVSNLLRKTGTSSRREVSALARRVGFATAD